MYPPAIAKSPEFKQIKKVVKKFSNDLAKSKLISKRMYPPAIAKSPEFKQIKKVVKKFSNDLAKSKLIANPKEFDIAFGDDFEYRLYFLYVGYDNDTMHHRHNQPSAKFKDVVKFLRNFVTQNRDLLLKRRAKPDQLDENEIVQEMFKEIEKQLDKINETDAKKQKKGKGSEPGVSVIKRKLYSFQELVAEQSVNSDISPVTGSSKVNLSVVVPTRKLGSISRSPSVNTRDGEHQVEEDLSLGTPSKKSNKKAARNLFATPKKHIGRGIPMFSKNIPTKSSNIGLNAAQSNNSESENIIPQSVTGPSRVDLSVTTPVKGSCSRKREVDEDESDHSEDIVNRGTRSSTKKRRIILSDCEDNEEDDPTIGKSRDRQRRYREQNPIQTPSRDRTRRYRELQLQESDSDDDIDDIKDPEIRPAIDLGVQDNECTFCGAMHFAGDQVCCGQGKVFFPPQKKVPAKLAHYLYDDYSGRSQFKKGVLSINNAFAMSSMTYNQADIAPHGVQTMKDIQEVMDQHNALGKLYYTMGEVIRDREAKGEEVSYVRMKIVDARTIEKNNLEGHPSIYRDPMISGDHIALFYNSTMEQKVKLPGLNIYGKRRPIMAAQPMFQSDPRIPGLCYPLLYPYGEIHFRRQTELYLQEKRTMTYIERLISWGQNNVEYANNWEICMDVQQLIDFSQPEDQNPTEIGPNNEFVENEVEEEEEEPVENDYTRQYEQTGTDELNDNNATEAIDFVERGGEVYPVVVNRANRANRRRTRQAQDTDEQIEMDDIDDDLLDAIAEDELPIGEENEMRRRENVGTNRDDDQIMNLSDEDDAENEVAFAINSEQDPVEEEEEEEEENENNREPSESKKRKYASYRDYGLYLHQNRMNYYRSRFSAAGKVGQLQLTDMCARLFEQRYSYAAQYHSEYMTSNKKTFLKAMQKTANRVDRTIGCLTTMPHTIPGSPRYLQKQYEHAVAMCNTLGKSDLFITITCNVNWPEIKNNIPAGETWADHPFLVNEVFKKKSEKILEVIVGKKNNAGGREKGLFGRVKWFTYSIEFQQRGPPHMHLIVSLKHKIKTAAQVDRICQATLPTDDDELRQLVEDFHIHRPCENDPEAYCRTDAKDYWKTGRKGFPKQFSNSTHLGDRNYPDLRRPDDGEKCTKHGYEADNRHVVPYNTTLLTLWRGHLNVEGYDRALVEALTSSSHADASQMTVEGHLMFPNSLTMHPGAKKQRQLLAKRMLRDHNVPLQVNGQKVLVLNEFWICQDMRALTSCEAAWEFAAYPRCGSSHTVMDLFVHGEDEEPIKYNPGEEEAMAERLATTGVSSRFKAWMKLNEMDPYAAQLTYNELPKHYKFVKDRWVKKTRIPKYLFGRVRSVHPNNKEVFAIRLLSSKQKGVTSFPELRTVEGDLHPTFVSAAKALGLMNDQLEWERALREAATEKMPSVLRRLYVSILLFNPVSDPVALWNQFKPDFFKNKQFWTDEMKEAQALRHIESGLQVHGQTLEHYGLPEVDAAHLPQTDVDDDSGTAIVSVQRSKRIATSLLKDLNDDQKNAHRRIIDGITNDEGKSYFIQGSGGTGKTRLMQALYHRCIGEGHKVLCVAHTGIAAMLLPFGSTSHRAFHIPLTVEDDMRANVHLETKEAEYLKSITLVFWDEATMTDRRIFSCVDYLLRQLHPESSNRLFGGVPFIFGGDWKQTLPIVQDVRGEGVINYTMIGSDLKRQVEILRLHKNMRAQYDTDFAEYIAKVGDGTANLETNLRPEDQEIELPTECLVESERELITKLFGTLDTPENKKEVFSKASILAVDNKTTFDVNEKVLKLIDAPLHEFLSIDEHDENSGFTALDPEVYHMQTPSGKPPHKLQLKIGAVVILLRNLNVYLGLVNGTRLIIEKIGKEVIYAKPLNPNPKTPKLVAIHRLMFSPSTAPIRETSFIRTQFPLRLAFCITCNRAQGQTLERAGLILRTPCFTHGQLYVALSRVRTKKDLFIYNAARISSLTNNVVYRTALV